MRIAWVLAVVMVGLMISEPSPAGIVNDGTLTVDVEWLDGTPVDTWCVNGYQPLDDGGFAFTFGGVDVPIDGTLVIDLTPGDYVVQAHDCTGVGFFHTFYDGQVALHLGDVVPVVSDETTAITIQVGAPGSISGSVVNQLGDPIPELDVWLWHEDGVTIVDDIEVDENGAFRFDDLGAATYLIELLVNYPNDLEEWYVGAVDAASATPITVLPGIETVLDQYVLTTTLFGQAGTTVSDFDAGTVDGCYEFFAVDGTLMDSVIGDPTGSVSFVYIDGTEVKIRFSQCGFTADALYAYGWVGGGTVFSDATTHVVPAYGFAGGTLEPDAYDLFDPWGGVWGKLTDASSGDGVAATVELHEVGGDTVIEVPSDALDGFYEALPLDGGGWNMRVVPTSSAYEPAWFPGVASEVDAATLDVVGGEWTAANMTLYKLTGTLSGSVGITQSGTLGGLDATVELYDLDGELVDATVSTGGQYTFEDTEFGTYHVRASADGYLSEWYDDAPGLRMDLATAVVVDDPVVESIDFRLDPLFGDALGTTFEDEIQWLVEVGVTFGCGDGLFCPNDVVSRAQMGSFFARALGLEPVAADIFDDVDGTHEGNINAIALEGITLGCNEDGTLYCPGVSINRAQIATFIGRALDYEPSEANHFTDDDTSSHEPYIDALRDNEVTFGCDVGLYCPSHFLTRGQMAALLYRALAGVLYPES